MEGGSIPPIWCSKKNVARRSERRGTQTPLDSPDSSTQSESERKRGQEVQGFANGVSPLDMLTQTHSWNISAQDLVIRDHDVKGTGSTGVVYCGEWKGQIVAVKRQRIRSSGSPHTARTSDGGCRDHSELMQEIMISALLPAHPNICQFHGTCLDPLDRSVINCVYEYVEGHDVDHLYSSMRRTEKDWRPPLAAALAWCIQLADGLACLHGCSPAVLHRDIKPSNLLVSTDLTTIKICDFGLCTLREYDADGCMLAPARRMTGGTGSFRYMAPEVVLDCGEYDTSIDIFSAACCIYFMTTGKPAMSEIEDCMLVARVVSEENVRQPLDLLMDHPHLSATISAAWDSNPARRPTAWALAALLREHREEVLVTPAHSPSRSGKALMRAISSMRQNFIGFIKGGRSKSRAAIEGGRRNSKSQPGTRWCEEPRPSFRTDSTAGAVGSPRKADVFTSLRTRIQFDSKHHEPDLTFHGKDVQKDKQPLQMVGFFRSPPLTGSAAAKEGNPKLKEGGRKSSGKRDNVHEGRVVDGGRGDGRGGEEEVRSTGCVENGAGDGQEGVGTSNHLGRGQSDHLFEFEDRFPMLTPQRSFTLSNCDTVARRDCRREDVFQFDQEGEEWGGEGRVTPGCCAVYRDTRKDTPDTAAANPQKGGLLDPQHSAHRYSFSI